MLKKILGIILLIVLFLSILIGLVIVIMSSGYTLLAAIRFLALTIAACLAFVGLLWVSIGLIFD